MNKNLPGTFVSNPEKNPKEGKVKSRVSDHDLRLGRFNGAKLNTHVRSNGKQDPS
jgi:hypothetical protein